MTRMERATAVFHAVADPIASLPSKYNRWLAELPSTNFRIQWTITAVMLTTFRYIASDVVIGSVVFKPWAPDVDWLAFLAVMAGIDTYHFVKKRQTANPDMMTRQNVNQED